MQWTEDYWAAAVRLLNDTGFIATLKAFDKDKIPAGPMQKIREKYLPDPAFQPSAVAKASSAAEGLCRWVRAMEMYEVTSQQIAPKRVALEQAEASYNATMESLMVKRKELATVEARLAELQAHFDEKMAFKKKLEEQVLDCQQKLERAQRLLECSRALHSCHSSWRRTLLRGPGCCLTSFVLERPLP